MSDQLREEIQRCVERYCEGPALRAAMLRALARPGFALHPDGACRAGALALGVYKAIRGTVDGQATLMAAAVELHMEAAYMFDAVADDDEERRCGFSAAEELALAIACLTCGAAIACEAAHIVRPGAASLPAILGFHRNCIGACGGQFLDARLEREQAATTDDALLMTALKSGSIGRLAAEFGASIATQDAGVVALCSELGYNLFTYRQLIDDLRDACPIDAPRRDLIQRKKTLPLVFFYKELGAHPTLTHYVAAARCPDIDGRDVRAAFEASGAETLGAIVAEVFLNRAKGNLASLRAKLASVEPIERLICSGQAAPEELGAAVGQRDAPP